MKRMRLTSTIVILIPCLFCGSFSDRRALGYSLDVRDYGALGDGLTDDTSAIQAAENALAHTEATLYFPPGRYLVTATIDFSSSTSIKGAGATIVEGSDGLAQPLFRWTNAKNFALDGIRFSGCQEHSGFTGVVSDARCAIWLEGCANFTVSDVSIAGKGVGIALKSCIQGCIRRSRLVGIFDPIDYGLGGASGYNYASAIYIGTGAGGCADIAVQDCYMEHWGSAVANLANSHETRITRTQGNGLCDNGIYISSGHDCVISDCSIKDVLGDGIKVRGGGHLVTRNHVEDVTVRGIAATTVTDGQYDYGTVVSQNTICRAGKIGIQLERGYATNPGLKAWVVTGNHVIDCGQDAGSTNYGVGISIGVAVGDGVVSHNVIKGDHGYSLRGAIAVTGAADHECEDVIISDNIIADANNTGLVAFYTKNLTIMDNLFLEIPQYGIYFLVTGSNDHLRVTGNIFDNEIAGGTTAVCASNDGPLTNALFAHNQAKGSFVVCVHRRCRTNGNIAFDNCPDGVTSSLGRSCPMLLPSLTRPNSLPDYAFARENLAFSFQGIPGSAGVFRFASANPLPAAGSAIRISPGRPSTRARPGGIPRGLGRYGSAACWRRGR